MSEQAEERQLAAIVAADRASTPPPDLVALRAGGRRLVRRRRLAAGAAAAVVALAVGVPLAVVGTGDESTAPDRGLVATATPTPTAPPSSAQPAQPSQPAEVSVPLPGGLRQDLLPETGEVLGEVVAAGDFYGYEQVVYAAESAGGTYVVVGIRYRGRLLRVVAALSPLDVEEPDGVDLWGGYRDDDGTYLLVGSVPGDVDLDLGVRESLRPPTRSSTEVLPGFTVFYDTGPWREEWDPLQAAPLDLETSDGTVVDVRGRTYVS
ncbi:MAG: hypothetical protein JWN84_4095 [Nocardioides sp.]|nr:hypothetical protein [Nocardioides sp.]